MPKRALREERRRAEEERVITVVLDENFGTDPACIVATAIRGVDRVSVEMLTDVHFPRQTQDHVWIPAVTRRGWIIVTKDSKIRRRPIEVDAWIRSGATICILTEGKLTGAQMGAVFQTALPIVRRRAGSWTKRPLIMGISAAGNVYVKYGWSPRGNKRDLLHLDGDTAEAVSLAEGGDDQVDEGRLAHPAHPKKKKKKKKKKG